MHPFRKLCEAGPPTPEQAAPILAQNVVMHSPVLIKPIVDGEVVAITISNSSRSRDDPGKHVFEGKRDTRTTLLRWQGTVEGHKIESPEPEDCRPTCGTTSAEDSRIWRHHVRAS